MKSLRTLLKCLLYLFLLIWISFLLPRILPGNPLYYFTGDHHTGTLSQEALQLKEHYGLGEPLSRQFLIYLTHLLHLDPGHSFYFHEPVLQRILPATKWTLLMALPSIVISSVLGIRLGVHLGLKPRRKGSALLSMLAAYQAIPVFLLASLAQLVLAYHLKLFPSQGAYSPGMTPASPGYLPDVLRHLLLPLSISILSSIPNTTLMAYQATLRCKKMHYMTFAHYLNIGAHDQQSHWIIPNILPEMMGKLNIQIMTALSGSLFVESVFTYPGLGTLLYNAIVWRDYPLLQAILLLTCTFGILVNALFEIYLNILTRNEVYA